VGKPVSQDRRWWLVAALLAVVTVGCYAKAFSHDFVAMDDDAYITKNRNVLQGLTISSISWAWTSTQAANWHPLTWMSHQLDVELYGVSAGGHHVTSILLHAMNVVMLLGALRALTGDLWRSAMVAALFALHPMHVESVAWVSERKDVLSTFFIFSAMWAYASYVRSTKQLATQRYVLVVVLFILSLCAKQMYVTFPAVLLLMDYWPLNRKALGAKQLIVEKLPLFALSIVAGAITIYAQNTGGAMAGVEMLDAGHRLSNAVVSIATYIIKLAWPTQLIPFYPFPKLIHTWQIAGAVIFLVVLSAAAGHVVKHRPVFLIGWLWFLGTLAPVIGILQVGSQAMADRFTYFPSIGLFIALAWGLPASLVKTHARMIAAAACIVLTVLGILTWHQTAKWRDTITLFTYTINVSPDNYFDHINLATEYDKINDLDKALYHINLTLKSKPAYAEAHVKKGEVLQEQGHLAMADKCAQQAIKFKPKLPSAHHLLAKLLIERKQYTRALTHIQLTIDDDHEKASAYNTQGNALDRMGRALDAVSAYRRAVELDPDNIGFAFNLGVCLTKIKKYPSAVSTLQQVAKAQPNNFEAQLYLAISLDKTGRHEQSLSHYLQVIELQPGHVLARANLCSLLFNQKQYTQSAAHMQKAISLDPDNADYHLHLARIMEKRDRPIDALEQYRETIRLNPKSAQAHNALGALFGRSGNIKRAIHYFNEALRLKPNYPHTKRNLERAQKILHQP